MIKTDEQRIHDEKKFHDEVFSTHARVKVGKFYAINGAIETRYETEIFSEPQGKTVLEYGCGMGSRLVELDALGAETFGVDISDFAIEQLNVLARHKGASTTYQVMNAEDLRFDNNKFHIIYGSGILHHLNLAKSFETLSKKLRADGKAIFIEPLGHNPIINWFRNRTPSLRTEDEHPLMMNDLRLAKDYFNKVTVTYFYLTTLAVPLVFGNRAPKAFIKLCDGVDRLVFAVAPFMRKYAWQVLIKLEGPVK